MFGRKSGPDPAVAAADSLYAALVQQARNPAFYRRLSVPDSLDGRFDLLAVHAFLVLAAIRGEGDAGKDLGTKLATAIFAGFEDALRELGVGDMGMSRRIKAMADGFYGRLAAYDAACIDQSLLAGVLLRNVYRGDTAREADATVLASYVMANRQVFSSPAGLSTLLLGQPVFAPLPE